MCSTFSFFITSNYFCLFGLVLFRQKLHVHTIFYILVTELNLVNQFCFYLVYHSKSKDWNCQNSFWRVFSFPWEHCRWDLSAHLSVGYFRSWFSSSPDGHIRYDDWNKALPDWCLRIRLSCCRPLLPIPLLRVALPVCSPMPLRQFTLFIGNPSFGWYSPPAWAFILLHSWRLCPPRDSLSFPHPACLSM